MIDRVAGAAGVEPGELTYVAAATGPGGFTGIRAGLAAAHGIALAAGARLVGATSFAAVAAASRARGFGCRSAETAIEADAARKLLVAIDSRRDDFCIQLFAEDHATPLAEPAAIAPNRLQSYIDGLIGGAGLLIAGDMAGRATDVLGLDRPVNLIPDSAPDALGVAAATLFGLRAGAAPGITLKAPVRPLYLRSPGVTLPPAKMPDPVAGL
jgi:tRNA threonylcarbamoyl adenosine modification protein YeaZ